jgi:uncharacterized RDD family membrane protein YckC
LRQYWVAPLPPLHIADGTAVTAAALADASPTPNIVIPANFLEIGGRLEFQAFGRFTSTATPGTIVVGIYLAASGAAIATGQALAATAAIVPVASSTNRTWRIEGNGSVRAVGTAGSIIGCLEVSNITSNGTDLAPATAPAAVTYDTTVPLTVRVGLTPSVATGSWQVHYIGVRAVA